MHICHRLFDPKHILLEMSKFKNRRELITYLHQRLSKEFISHCSQLGIWSSSCQEFFTNYFADRIGLSILSQELLLLCWSPLRRLSSEGPRNKCSFPFPFSDWRWSTILDWSRSGKMKLLNTQIEKFIEDWRTQEEIFCLQSFLNLLKPKIEDYFHLPSLK
jgi:hypothetical protein